MKSLFLFYFLLPLASKATLQLPESEECYHSFANYNVTSSQKSLQPIERATIVDFLQSKDLVLNQKQNVFEFFSQLNPEQLISVFNDISVLDKNQQNSLLDSILIEALISAAKKKIFQFNKQQLMEIIYLLKEMEFKPSEDFILSWRQATLKKRKEFQSFDRYFLSGLFKKLGILPLKDPYYMNTE